jgi:hypothetical protein
MTADSEVFALAQVRESLNQAMKFHAAGEIDRAEQYYREVLKDRYRVLDVPTACRPRCIERRRRGGDCLLDRHASDQTRPFGRPS